MTKHIKKLDRLNTRIRECEKELENIKTLPYYTLFKQAQQAGYSKVRKTAGSNKRPTVNGIKFISNFGQELLH